jgi:hypothetical protein
MSQWGNLDQANNSVLWGVVQAKRAPTATERDAFYGNTSVNAYVSDIAIGQFGVSAAEAANTTGEGKKVAHAGWNLRTLGTGSLSGVVVVSAGTGYANSDTLSIAATTPATGNLITNATGNVVSFSVTSGADFTSATPTVTITTAGGTGASITATAGGRAGRVQYETLVAMGSQNDGTTDDSILPQ